VDLFKQMTEKLKKYNVLAIGLLAVYLLICLFIGCSGDNSTQKPGIAISMATFQIERLTHEASTITRLAGDKGLAVITMDAGNSVERQKQHIIDFIKKKIPVIMIVAVDGKALSREIELAYQQGLHVIAYDRLILSPHLTAYISFDNMEVGRQQAQAVLEAAPNGNYVLLGGSPTDNNAHLVRKGQLEVLTSLIDRGQINIIEDLYINNWEAHLAFFEMEKIFKKHGARVDAVVASNDDIALGAIQAMKLKGLSKKVPISGQDATAEGCKAIVEGDLIASVFKDINQLAPLAFKIAEDIIYHRPLNLEKLPLKDLSPGENINGFVPCKFLQVTRIDKTNIYDRIILTKFHEWRDVYRDLPLNQRPPNPNS
jgi:D-xylose transport system substrate-binding protein